MKKEKKKRERERERERRWRGADNNGNAREREGKARKPHEDTEMENNQGWLKCVTGDRGQPRNAQMKNTHLCWFVFWLANRVSSRDGVDSSERTHTA